MHYKNGREAKNGDKVVLVPTAYAGASGATQGLPVVGILYDAVAGQEYCNGRLALTSPSDPTLNLKECLHIEDAQAALNTVVAPAK
jgi:hypothetical protein